MPVSSSSSSNASRSTQPSSRSGGCCTRGSPKTASRCTWWSVRQSTSRPSCPRPSRTNATTARANITDGHRRIHTQARLHITATPLSHSNNTLLLAFIRHTIDVGCSPLPPINRAQGLCDCWCCAIAARLGTLGFAEPLKALTLLAQKQNKNAKAHVDVWQQPQRPTGTRSPPFGAILFYYF